MFNEFITIMFETWWSEYSKQHSANVEQFKEPLRRSFLDGWLECEKFYEDEH